ncbi:MAG: gene transfer agent family protein [Novosphingobium sp.]|nr:gene transfer agent family protein [Novosphingobium sp.]
MSQTANPHRGEATLVIDGEPHVLRPTFSALVAAEEEIGPLFALVERAGNGELRLGEMVSLFWHCLEQKDRFDRNEVGKAVADQGLAACASPLRSLLAQILQGRG